MDPVNAEIQRLGGDPSDDVWWWLANRGPHGTDFTWGQTRSSPPGYVGLAHLEEIIASQERAIPGFSERARTAALVALDSSHPDLIRRGLQVLGAVGTSDDLRAAKLLTSSSDSAVVADAKACMFQLKGRG